MKTQAWLERLGRQLPGWYVWHTMRGWHAAPITKPEDAAGRLAANRHPNRLGPYRTPQQLRAEALLRYGAGDHCETCLCPWEQCGHRQDETKVSRCE